MKIEIKHRYSRAVLFFHDVKENTLKISLAAALKAGANLREANLDGERLDQNPIKLSGMLYWVLISESYMRIGCQRHTHVAWAAFNDAEIKAMGSGARIFWNQWKEVLLGLCKAHANKVKEETSQ